MSLDLPALSVPRERARQVLLERLRNPESVVGHDVVARSLVQHGVACTSSALPAGRSARRWQPACVPESGSSAPAISRARR